MTVLIAATGPAGERAKAALSARETACAESLATVREHAPEADVVVAGPVSDGDAAAVAAVVECAAPGTPVLDADEPRLATAIERAIQARRYQEAVDELYALACERANGNADESAFERARSAADEAFERVRRLENRTPYDRLLDDEHQPESEEDDQTNP